MLDMIMGMLDLNTLIGALGGGVATLVVIALVAGLGKLKKMTAKTTTTIDDEILDAVILALVEQGALAKEEAEKLLGREIA